jgi:hypothetical protein
VLHTWANVSDAQVSQRLTELINTYWDSSRWIYTAALNDPYAQFSTNETSGEPYNYLALNRTDATITRELAIYKASATWIFTLFLCSSILLLLGIANIVVTLQTSVPDIFGYVSSLTRENPYVEIPGGGTMLDGTERMRLIKDLKVQLVDIRQGEDVGYIALKSLERGAATSAGRIQKNRLYN